jgi:hypothetical protein
MSAASNLAFIRRASIRLWLSEVRPGLHRAFSLCSIVVIIVAIVIVAIIVIVVIFTPGQENRRSVGGGLSGGTILQLIGRGVGQRSGGFQRCQEKDEGKASRNEQSFKHLNLPFWYCV